jgi:hypothetical protein
MSRCLALSVKKNICPTHHNCHAPPPFISRWKPAHRWRHTRRSGRSRRAGGVGWAGRAGWGAAWCKRCRTIRHEEPPSYHKLFSEYGSFGLSSCWSCQGRPKLIYQHLLQQTTLPYFSTVRYWLGQRAPWRSPRMNQMWAWCTSPHVRYIVQYTLWWWNKRLQKCNTGRAASHLPVCLCCRPRYTPPCQALLALEWYNIEVQRPYLSS